MSYALPILAGLSSITVLFFLYKNIKSDSKKVLASLYFVKKLKPRPVTSSKKKYPLRFYLELLFLTISALILYLVQIADAEKTIKLIIDHSQSMGAPYQGSTRFEAAKKDILNLISQEGNSTTYSVEISPQELTNKDFSSKLLSPGEIKTYIENLQISPLTDKFSSLQSTTDKQTELLIYTDKKIDSKNIIQKHQYYESVSNIALRSVSLSKDNDTTTVNINYFFSGEGSNYFEFHLDNLSDNKPILTEKLDLLTGGAGSSSIKLSSSLKQGSILKAYISNTLQKDALSSDNEITFIAKYSQPDSIYLVSDKIENKTKLESLSNILPGNAKFILEKDFNSLKDLTASLVIYYGISDFETLKGPSLAILPNSSNSLVDIKGTIKDPKISSWNESSPITRYINFESLKIYSALKLSEAPWGNSIIRANGAVSMIEGHVQQTPLVVSGFELLPYEGKKSLSASILTLNIIKKLLSSTQSNNSSSPFFLTDQLIATSLSSNTEHKGPSYLPTGVFKVSKNNEKELIESNSFSQEESDTYRYKEEKVEAKEGKNEITVFKSPLLKYLTFSLLLILFLDMLLIFILGREA